MLTSPEIDQISLAITLAQVDIEAAPKDKINPHFKSRYADLTSIWDACRPSLGKHGLAVIQSPSMTDGRFVKITTRIIHKSGQWIQSELDLKPVQDTPQATGSAITYGRRYSLGSMLGIVSEEDDDGNAASSKTKSYSAPAVPATPPKYSELPQEKQILMAIMSKYSVKPDEMGFVSKSLLGRPMTTLEDLVKEYVASSPIPQ